MAARYVYSTSGTSDMQHLPGAAGIRYDTADDLLKFLDDDGSTVRTVVTTAQTQTLTNKTLTSPAITGATLTSPTITTGITPTASDGAALGSGSLMFSDLFLASGAVVNFNNGNVTITHAAGKLTVAVPAPTGAIDAFTVGVTGGAAAQGTVRGIVSSLTTFGTAMTSGTVTALRGVVTLGAATNGVTYAYGTQGKFVSGANAIASGSGHVCGLLAQMDLSGGSVTSGHVAPLIVSGQSLVASANVNMIYLESGGNKVNAAMQFNVAADYLFDINNFESCGIVATGAATAGANIKKIKIMVDGVPKYFICADDWS